MRRTKIVCTLGPASSSPVIIESLIKAGMDMARLNFSHGSHEKHEAVIRHVREISNKIGRPVAILQDLQGPRIRVGEIGSHGILLKKGQQICVTTRDVIGNDTVVPVTYPNLHEDIKEGDHLLMDDGLLDLKVERVEEQDIHCKVLVGGPLSSHKGINLPGVQVRVSSLSEKDRADLRFGLEHGVDYVAISFVRTREDVEELRREIASLGANTPVIAKIEKPEATHNIDDIIEAADGIMVARGDLGVEMGPERVPIIQKEIIQKCIAASKPVITATQMLESMRHKPRPTRAEASDVANAIFDRTDAVMLSGETSVGNYPVESLRMMDRIAGWAERHVMKQPGFLNLRRSHDNSFPDAIGEAAFHTAQKLKAKAIVAFTRSGFTARMISKHRPESPVFAFTPDETVRRQLILSWGVVPLHIPLINTIDELIEKVDGNLRHEGFVRPGDIILIISGAPLYQQGTTNMLTLHRAGNGPVK
jgi:pyruvate kinase